MLPDIALTRLDGRTENLRDYSGKVLERYAPQQGAKDIRKDLMPVLAAD